MFHTEEELKKYRISTYDSIRLSKELCCLDCGKATEFKVHAYHIDPIILGWCETPQGFMIVKECPRCGCKYRFHLCTSDKFDYVEAMENFSLYLYLEENKKRD